MCIRDRFPAVKNERQFAPLGSCQHIHFKEGGYIRFGQRREDKKSQIRQGATHERRQKTLAWKQNRPISRVRLAPLSTSFSLDTCWDNIKAKWIRERPSFYICIENIDSLGRRLCKRWRLGYICILETQVRPIAHSTNLKSAVWFRRRKLLLLPPE